VLRHAEEGHEFHRRLHVFSESIEHALTALVLIMLGGALPFLWPVLDWRYLAVGTLLVLVVRPAVGWLSLLDTRLSVRERTAVSFYGIRGIGSIYYLSYATGRFELLNEPQLWAVVALSSSARSAQRFGDGQVLA
jgi:NhaP-type Na+/H+ or K+/H+ antiporter